MSYLNVQNNQMFPLEGIPFLNKNDFQESVLNVLDSGFRMIGLFPVNKNFPQKIISVFIDSISSQVCITGGEFEKDKLEFESFANKFPHTNYFECELSENFNYIPANHPWLRPVRKQNVILKNKPYNFYKLEGEEVHEVAVGPIHAGVIEPGHFRFQCHGELVYHLEINLGYQHRGVEELMLNANPNQRIILAESIAGDTVIGHTTAHCNAIESLSGTPISLRQQVIRAISEELERIAMHLSSLGGIANDVGFAIVASSYGRLRTLVINSLALICGSRFGRGLFVYGGIRYDLNNEVIDQVLKNLETVKNDIKEINDYLFSSTGALYRFENTGTVSSDFAKQIGMVGLAARACGIETDIRAQLPYGAYRYTPVSLITLVSSDVFARARLRALEIDESLRFINGEIQNLPEGKVRRRETEIKKQESEVRSQESEEEILNLTALSGVVSISEGWRGEIVHIAITDNNGIISQYKIKDPSFNNWYGLSLALRKTDISDFPLCNKSFDLSYAGHDL